MIRDRYEPIKLNQTNRYPGYQFHARVRIDGMEPAEAFRYLILSVYHWIRSKVPKGDQKAEELLLPEAEEYASVGDDSFLPYHFSVGYTLDITPLMGDGIWALRLKEPDKGVEGEREAVPGRMFTTRVGLRLSEKGYTELGIRIDVTDPASVEKELEFAFRPGFVRSLVIQPSVCFEHVREMKYGQPERISTDEDYKRFLFMLDNEENQLPLVVFTHFRPGEKKKSPAVSMEDFVKNDPLKSFLQSAGFGTGFPGASEKALEFKMPVMPETGSGKMPVMPQRTVTVPATSSAAKPASVSASAAEPPVMPYDADSFARSAFAYALTYVLGDKYYERLKDRLKKDFRPGDIVICGARKFRGMVAVTDWPGSGAAEQKKAYCAALLAAQSYSKHKAPFEFGSVVFEAEARKLAQQKELREILESGTLEEKERYERLARVAEEQKAVINEKDEKIARLEKQCAEEFDRGMAFRDQEYAILEEKNSGLKEDLAEARERIGMMEGRYQEAKEILGVLNELRAVSELPETREDVVQYFRRVYSDRIDFTDRGLNTAAKCELKPASLWEVLYAVANGLTELFRNSTGNLTEKDVQEATGYRASFGEGSMTRENAGMMRQREDVYEDKVISVEPHLKLRNGKEEKENQRLHFWYDPDRRRIVISWLGEHLDSVSGRRKT